MIAKYILIDKYSYINQIPSMSSPKDGDLASFSSSTPSPRTGLYFSLIRLTEGPAFCIILWNTSKYSRLHFSDDSTKHTTII